MAKNEVVATKSLQELMASPIIQKKFRDVLGNESKAASFVSSVIAVANGNAQLRNAEPMSILSAAMVSATLDLSVVSSIGEAYILPYGRKAQLIVGYRGILALAMRSGEFKNIIDEVVYEGQLVKKNKFTGEYIFDEDAKVSDTPIGVMARFDLINGYSKTIYWSMEEIKEHAKRFSQAYRNGYDCPWKTDFLQMARKVVLSALLKKYAPKSTQMNTALKFDQSVVKINADRLEDINIDLAEAEYVDNPKEVKDPQKASEVQKKFADFDSAEEVKE